MQGQEYYPLKSRGLGVELLLSFISTRVKMSVARKEDQCEETNMMGICIELFSSRSTKHSWLFL
jgi:hypothetical protein